MFVSCEEIIDIDLDEGVTRLVVEGRVEKIQGRLSGSQVIKLSTTDDYFSQAHTPEVQGAVVVVSDDLNNTFQFMESATEPGSYTTDSLFAETDRTYTLTIEYDGDTYTAQETLLSVAAIDSIYQVYQEDYRPSVHGGNDLDEGYVPTIDYSDPAGIENYYQWEIYVDGEYRIEADPGNLFRLIQNDELYDGQQVIGHTPDGHLFLEPGQVVMIRQMSLSRVGYDFLSLFFSQSAERGMFDTPPATIRGNVINVTDSGHYPLGIFGASEVAEAEIVIQDE